MSKEIMSKEYIKGLYDMSSYVDDEGKRQINEAKLKREIESSAPTLRRNKQIYQEIEPKLETCTMYSPCPLCDKCMVKASHLYLRCQTCKIAKCVHKYSDKNFMLKRKNFILKADSILGAQLKKLEEDFLLQNNN